MIKRIKSKIQKIKSKKLFNVLFVFILIFSFFSFVNVVFALDGEEDVGFYNTLTSPGNGKGLVIFDVPNYPLGDIRDMIIDSNSNIVIGGGFNYLNGFVRYKLIKLNISGQEISSFYSNLGSSFNDDIHTLLLLPNDDILVGGRFYQFNGSIRRHIIRLNSNGTLDTDTGFNSNATNPGFEPNNTDVLSLLLFGDGDILVGGSFTQFNSNTQNRIARLNNNGTLDADTNFNINIGTGFNDNVSVLLQLPDGDILVGGSFTQFNGNTQNRIARLNNNGTLDTDTNFNINIGTGFNDYNVSSLAVLTDGNILVGGSFTQFNGSAYGKHLIRFNNDGTVNTSFNTNMGAGFKGWIQGYGADVKSIVIQGDKIVVGGEFRTFDNNQRHGIARLNNDGTEDVGFFNNFSPSSPYENVNCGTNIFGFVANSNVGIIRVQSNDQKLLVGGFYSCKNDLDRSGIVRLFSSGGTPPVPTVTLSATPLSINENGEISIITATISGTTTAITTVTLSVNPTSTAEGGDYTMSTTITIPAGTNQSGSTILTANNDTDADDEIVVVDINTVAGGNGATEDGNQSVSITIIDNDAPPPPPTVTLSANPTAIDSGDDSILTWEVSNATSCTASSSPSNSQWDNTTNPASGDGTHTQTITNITDTTIFSIFCSNNGGDSPTVSATVSVNVLYDAYWVDENGNVNTPDYTLYTTSDNISKPIYIDDRKSIKEGSIIVNGFKAKNPAVFGNSPLEINLKLEFGGDGGGDGSKYLLCCEQDSSLSDLAYWGSATFFNGTVFGGWKREDTQAKVVLANIDDNLKLGDFTILKKSNYPYVRNFIFASRSANQVGNTFAGINVAENANIFGSYKYNTGIGTESFFNISSTTKYNTVVGYKSLFSFPQSLIGDDNTGLGSFSLYNNTTGNNNTAVGYKSLFQNSTGNNNIAIGYNAGPYLNYSNNTTAIGYNAKVNKNNAMVFGNTDNINNNILVGWGFGTQPGSNAISVNGISAHLTKNGVWTNASDRSFKHNIKNINYGLKEILKLRPVDFNWNGSNKKDIGFIAQEVKEILPEIVSGEEGKMTMSYGQIGAVIVSAIAEQQDILENDKVNLNDFEKELEELENKI